MPDNKKFYYSFGKQYRLNKFNQYLDQIAKELSDLSDSAKILDLCCGEGRFLSNVNRNYSIYCLDIDKKGLEIARTRKQTQDLIQQHDIREKLPFSNNFFSAILFWRAFHYHNAKLRKSILKEIYRTLKHSGKLYLATYSKSDWKYVNSDQKEKNKKDLLETSEFYSELSKFAVRYFSRNELNTELTDAGFRIQSLEEIQEPSGYDEIQEPNTYWFAKAVKD